MVIETKSYRREILQRDHSYIVINNYQDKIVNKVQHTTIRLSDYKIPEYLVDDIYLTFKLEETKTIVTARTAIRRNPQSADKSKTLFLHGDSLQPESIVLDGDEVEANMYDAVTNGLYLYGVPESFELEITTILNPRANTSLNGLYLSSGNFCTQCEAEGFRRITYYLDRPDVLARFTTRIEANSDTFPILLSNGNLLEKGMVDEHNHFVVWEDPFPKPCYLFALVAGDLVCIEDTFITMSRRTINLEIYVQEQNQRRCDHAMESLKKAMRWDEMVYGLEYDLDRYMIVAVDDFNMGAMENKGLNIFNSKYVLASQETATDQDYLGVEGVIAHEYFHNWTGNRVTCRDWFQLSLKEGLTVFRDQEFSSDMNSRVIQRIDDVRTLRQFQFREDAGPMAHPVRPKSYMEINNFYTVTVYNKGAELVRMIHTLIGAENFRLGMDLYIQRHDGQAVTCEDFVSAMSDASQVNLDQFLNWYLQAGTPHLSVEDDWNETTGEYTLTIAQSTRPTFKQEAVKPFHIPILVGLLKVDNTSVRHTFKKVGDDILLELTKSKQTFAFHGLEERPIPSLLRKFSAPVRVSQFYSRDELLYLMANDTDLFNRWDASHTLATSIILELTNTIKRGREPVLPDGYCEAIRKNLVDSELDKSLIALALTLPAESYLAQSMDRVEPEFLHAACQFVKKDLARRFYDEFLCVYRKNETSDGYQITPEEIGKRRLRNCCLSYLLYNVEAGDSSVKLCLSHYHSATNMTDQVAALTAISHHTLREKDDVMTHFENSWISEPLVMDKWFSIQALSEAANTFKRVKKLTGHPAFSMTNPNKVRSLIGAYSANHYHFHENGGSGYQFLRKKIIQLDPVNPQIAARLVTPFTTWKRYDTSRQTLIKSELETILARKTLSRDVFEIVNKSLHS